MLQELRIKNLALLESLELVLPEDNHGLIVFTGETGAGKSIILKAVNLLAGGRGNASWVRSGAEKAEIEALFSGKLDSEVRNILKEHELLVDNVCLIRRTISNKGRSRLFVNDSAVTARLSAELSNRLVNIASQHDHQQLLKPSHHLDLLDSYGELWPLREDFSSVYRKWQKVKKELDKLHQKEQDKEQRRDFLQYQLTEIDEVAPVAGEDEELRRERRRLQSSATLATLARESADLLQNELGVHLAVIRKNMEEAASLDESIQPLADRIISTCFEVEELERDIISYNQGLPQDEFRLEEINERLSVLKGLQRKYGSTIEDVVAYAEEARAELDSLADLEDELVRLEQEVVDTEEVLQEKAKELSQARHEVGRRMKKNMAAELESLHFFQAEFVVAIKNMRAGGQSCFGRDGIDEVEFLFSANPGEEAKPLAKVVSGGELSRLMLAMKCMLARQDKVGTVIFDEVDAGIGGQTAEAVAAKICELAGHHQVLCITHLPQIAAYASTHYKVEKQVNGNRTYTTIRQLSEDERVRELARMLAGEDVSEQTMAYARELGKRRMVGG